MVSVENNSILKKISAVIVMITALVFFSFNVFASTYNPSTYNTYQDSVTYNGLTYSVRVTQLKAQSTGTSMLEAGMETTMLVTLQLTNGNDSTVACTIPKLTIDISDERIITGVETYGGDVTLSLLTGGTVVFLPNEEFSYQNNKIVVPANKSVYCIGAIYLPAKLNQTGTGTEDTGLRGVHLYDKSNYQVTVGDYSYGNPVDLSSIVTYIDNIESYIDNIESYLQDIKNACIYTGNGFTVDTSNTLNKLFTFSPSSTNSGLTGISVNVRRVAYPVILNNVDFEIDSGSDQLLSTYTYMYKVATYIYVNNTSGKAVRINRLPTLGNFVPSGSAISIDSFSSNYFNTYALNNLNLILGTTFRVPDSSSTGILPYGKDYTFIQSTVYTNTKLTSWDYTFNIFSDSDIYDTTYYPESMDTMFYNWFNSYNQVNGLDDSSDLSNDVADVSDSNHIIEESYYSANASAIQATGLSNYHFSNEQNNGIGSVSNDFMLLWNALGSWNGVYIFSLTMALATFIMRHGGLFTVKRKESDKGGEE